MKPAIAIAAIVAVGGVVTTGVLLWRDVPPRGPESIALVTVTPTGEPLADPRGVLLDGDAVPADVRTAFTSGSVVDSVDGASVAFESVGRGAHVVCVMNAARSVGGCSVFHVRGRAATLAVGVVVKKL